MQKKVFAAILMFSILTTAHAQIFTLYSSRWVDVNQNHRAEFPQ